MGEGFFTAIKEAEEEEDDEPSPNDTLEPQLLPDEAPEHPSGNVCVKEEGEIPLNEDKHFIKDIRIEEFSVRLRNTVQRVYQSTINKMNKMHEKICLS